ncbi:MAG: hypothetical protein LKI39_14570 [Bacteroides sp.]|jgi:hypothetical protein|nr:hypothetical protein [Bacteroides sp.]MCI1683756.1 hypothetical protein [Bacteroides sp.]
MEDVFKTKGFTSWDGCIIIAIVVILLIFAFLKSCSVLIVAFPSLFLSINEYSKKYIVKDNGDLWVRSMLGVRQKATGIYRILYDPNAKGWNWRTRQMIITHKKGFFSITPDNPKELLALLRKKIPDIEIINVEIPVNNKR